MAKHDDCTVTFLACFKEHFFDYQCYNNEIVPVYMLCSSLYMCATARSMQCTDGRACSSRCCRGLVLVW
jgi:hypothetical protein